MKEKFTFYMGFHNSGAKYKDEVIFHLEEEKTKIPMLLRAMKAIFNYLTTGHNG